MTDPINHDAEIRAIVPKKCSSCGHPTHWCVRCGELQTACGHLLCDECRYLDDPKMDRPSAEIRLTSKRWCYCGAQIVRSNFCSVECADKWANERYSTAPELREILEKMLNTLKRACSCEDDCCETYTCRPCETLSQIREPLSRLGVEV